MTAGQLGVVPTRVASDGKIALALTPTGSVVRMVGCCRGAISLVSLKVPRCRLQHVVVFFGCIHVDEEEATISLIVAPVAIVCGFELLVEDGGVIVDVVDFCFCGVRLLPVKEGGTVTILLMRMISGNEGRFSNNSSGGSSSRFETTTTLRRGRADDIGTTTR